jgi:hypothetical protein
MACQLDIQLDIEAKSPESIHAIVDSAASSRCPCCQACRFLQNFPSRSRQPSSLRVTWMDRDLIELRAKGRQPIPSAGLLLLRVFLLAAFRLTQTRGRKVSPAIHTTRFAMLARRRASKRPCSTISITYYTSPWTHVALPGCQLHPWVLKAWLCRSHSSKSYPRRYLYRGLSCVHWLAGNVSRQNSVENHFCKLVCPFGCHILALVEGPLGRACISIVVSSLDEALLVL